MAATYESCSFCPQLCRHVCPVAVATGHEAATPAKMMTAVLLAQRGRIPSHDAARAAALCSGCGACRDHCKYGIDVPAMLADARSRFAAATEPRAPEAVQGLGELVAVTCDERRWSAALARLTGQDVATMRTRDHLGWAALEHRERAAPHLVRLHAALAGRTAVSSCSRCLAVLAAARVPTVRVEALAPIRWEGPVFACHGEHALPGTTVEHGLACCGAHGPLPLVHPALAADVAREAAGRLPSHPVATADSVCRHALRAAGAELRDPIDFLLDGDTTHAT
jgi:ferredoxin